MSIVMENLISKLSAEEINQVIDYMQYVLSKRDKQSTIEAYDNFLKLRKEAEENGVSGMSLDEINEEISKYRMEKKNSEVLCSN